MFDVECTDTGAVSHSMDETPAKTLEKGEDEKTSKHGERVALAENSDFLPIVCSVYGTMGFHCRQLIKTCTERMVEQRSGESSGDLSRVLCLNRARFQAAVWKATALCLVGRRGKSAEKAVKDAEKRALAVEVTVPWICVATDSGCHR